MSGRVLDAAGIVDPALRRSYEAARRLHAAHGRTYYLATLLLPAWKRPSVHALYGFARYADEIVDAPGPTHSAEEKAARLSDWADRFWRGDTDDAVLPAVRDTIERWELPREHFRAFLDSMRMDLTVTAYATFDDLMAYMHGSAAVIGLQMLPILGHPGVPRPVVEPYAADLGVAFQLTNFIRDVDEDLRRGRIYLPAEDLAHFGVDPQQLRAGVVDGRVRRLLAYEIARTRELLRSAEHGIRLLEPSSRDCIRVALRLYGGILDEVERADYHVLDRRVSVSLSRRLAVAGAGLVRAYAARAQSTPRRPNHTQVDSVTSTSAKPNARSSTGA